MSDEGRKARIPLSVPVLAGNEQEYVHDCIASGWVSAAGPYVTRLEDEICAFTGAAHAVACTSGTAALHLALVLAGVGPGDAVIVPTITFIASANAVRYCAADPILIGCDAHMNLDAVAVRLYLERCDRRDGGAVHDPVSGARIKAIMPVHVYGNLCDMEAVTDVAEAFGLAVIEDATESLGSVFTAGRYAGRHAGTIGGLAALSFNGNKIMTTGGGGMLLVADPEVAERARYLSTQAKDDTLRFVHGETGYNYRMSNVLAAIGVAQLEQLPGFIEVKQRNWQRYHEGLAGVPGLTFQDAPEGTRSNRWFYALEVDAELFGMDREGLMAALDDAGIDSRPLWLPLHLQPPYKDCRAESLERAVWYWERVLSLPCSSDLAASDVDRVISVIRSCARS